MFFFFNRGERSHGGATFSLGGGWLGPWFWKEISQGEAMSYAESGEVRG